MRLYLIRHGETDHNSGRLALGRQDVPLNERGRLQARALAEAFRARGDGIIAVYASPLQRTFDTATALAQALGLDVQTDERLIEMDIGEIEDQSLDDVRVRYPEFVRRWLSDDAADVSMPGGESPRQVQERGWAAIEEIRGRHPDETVAVVTHNFVALSVLCRALGMPLARFRSVRQDLAAVSVLELTAERQTVLTLNDTCHLRAEGLDGARSWRRA